MKNKLLIFCLFLHYGLKAQKDFIGVNSLATPPYSNRIDELINNTNITTFLLNKTNNNLQVKFFITIKKDGTPILRTNERYALDNPINFAPNENKLMDFKQFRPLQEKDIEILPEAQKLGVDRSDILRTRKLPEGNYEICVSLFDFTGQDRDQWNLPDIGCASMELNSFEVPQIIDINGKSCGEKINVTNPQFVTITWLKPAGFMGLIEYEIEIVEVFPNNREFNDAIFTTTKPVFLSEKTNATIFVINLVHQPLKQGARYVFRVKAIDPSGNASFRNNGFSQVCSFIYGDVAEDMPVSNISADIIYPNFNDTVPFVNPITMIKWSPYMQNIENVTVKCIIKENNQQIHLFETVLEASSGIVNKLKTLNNGEEVTEETAKQILIGKYEENGVENLLTRGKDYQLEITLDYKFKNNPVVQTINKSVNFYYGMPAAKLQLMNNNPDTGNLNFTISFFDKKDIPVGDFTNINQLKPAFDFDNLKIIKEKAVIEFSPQSSFDSVWYRKNVNFDKSIDITNPSSYILFDDIYNDISFSQKIKETGNWFARLKWSTFPENNNNQTSYYTSSSLAFTLGDSVDRSNTNCLAGDCIFPPIPMNERLPKDSLKVGMILKIGHHQLKVTNLNGNSPTAAPYSGEGVIKINPFPGIGGVDIPVKVKFTDIRFKADYRVFQGKAESIDGSGFFTDKNSSEIAAKLADSTENKNTIKTFIQNAANYIQNQISEDVGMPMPIGFADNKFAGTTYKLAIANIEFTTEKAEMNLILGVNNPTLGNHFDFVAQGVCLRTTGLSISKILLKQIGKREIGIGNSKKLVISGASSINDTKSYIEWDCNGFKNMHLVGYIEIDTTVIKNVVVNKGYAASKDSSFVKAHFNINIKSWNDFVLDLSLEKPFEIAGLPEWLFKSSNLVLDLSSVKNPIGISFPTGYSGLTNNEWQGIYLKDLEVFTPVGFKDKTRDSLRLSFNIQNLIIDRTGVSVNVTKSNLLPLNKGKFSDWAIGIDLVELKIMSNSFQYGKIDGKLRVPIDQSKDFGYQMILAYETDAQDKSFLSYQTTVSTISQLDVPMWKAKFNVLPNSHAKFYYNSKDSTYAELKINGMFSIDNVLPKIGKLEFNGIKFQDFIIRSSNTATTDSNYFQIGSISFASPQKKAGGFPVNFKDFKPVSKNEVIDGKTVKLMGLQMNLDVNLKMGVNSFGGETRMNLWAKPNKKDGILGYEYHEFEVDSIGVRGKISVIEVEGGIKFYDNDPVYGNGLKGNLMAQFTPGIGLGALAYFGEVTQNNKKFDYWGVFGSVTLSNGIPILGAFEIAGFGGGAYNNMEMVLPASPPISREVKLNSSGLIPTLKPKFDIFGFRATVFAQSFPAGTSWKAALSLGAEIKKSDFSLQKINFQGNMWMMTPPEKPNETPKAAFWAGMFLNYDFVKEQFDGNFSFYVNKTLSENVALTGIQPNDRAGTILLHYSKPKWFVYAGTPNDRCGIKINSPNVTLNGYFVMGTEVPGIPALPQKIRNVINTPISSTRSSEIGQGKGFGFGAEFGINTGEKKFLFMTASLDLLVGFDMSLMQYENASCDGLSTSKIGIDGWYARGQLYAYAEGKINADIDVWFYQGKVEIMDCKAGMVLEGGLPAPSWMKGTIAGTYSLFAGRLKGNFNFQAQIGKECRPALLQESPVIDMKIIADVKPSHNSEGYNIFDKPEVLCNFKLNQEFSIEVTDNNGVKKNRTFRPKVTLKVKEGNSYINAYYISYVIGETENLAVNLNSNLPFKPMQSHTLELTEFFEEKINNSWTIAKDKNNQPVRSVRIVTFKTGEVPATIPESIITEMNPSIRENFFMKNRWSESGALVANQFGARFSHNLRQHYLLDSIFVVDNNFVFRKVKANYFVKFSNVADLSEVIEQPIIYYSGGTTLTAQSSNLSNLKNGAVYKIEIIRRPENNSNHNQNLVVANFYNTQFVNKLNNPNFKMDFQQNSFKNEYKNNSNSSKDFILFTTYFAVSKYDNFEQKVRETKIFLNLSRPNNSIAFNIKNQKDEYFDEMEWNKKLWLKDIIKTGVNWYKCYDSMLACQAHINNYRNITFSAVGINVSWASNINGNYEVLKDENSKFRNLNQRMWNCEPLSNNELIKKANNNNEFLSMNRFRNGQNFVSNFEPKLKIDRTTINNDIAAVLTKHSQARTYLRNSGITSPPTGPGKLIDQNTLNYLSSFMYNNYIPRKTDGQSYHSVWWYYSREYFDIMNKQINNYKINSIIDR